MKVYEVEPFQLDTLLKSPFVYGWILPAGLRQYFLYAFSSVLELFLNLFLNILRTFLEYGVLSSVLELFLKFVLEHF